MSGMEKKRPVGRQGIGKAPGAVHRTGAPSERSSQVVRRGDDEKWVGGW